MLNSLREHLRRLSQATPKSTTKTPAVRFEPLEKRLLFSANPIISLDLPGEDLLNDSFGFSTTVENAGDTTGYGPFVDLRAGKGVDIDGAPSYLGSTVRVADSVNNSDGLAAVEYTHVFTGELISVEAGEEYYVYELPIGSVVPDLPPVVLNFTGSFDSANEDAAVGVPVPIEVRTGYRFGEDAQNNPSVDPPSSAHWITQPLHRPSGT